MFTHQLIDVSMSYYISKPLVVPSLHANTQTPSLCYYPNIGEQYMSIQMCEGVQKLEEEVEEDFG